MVWGFNRKATAEAAAAITRQRPPSQYMQPADPGQGMTWVVKTIGDGLPAMADGPPIVPGKAKCEAYKINSAEELDQLLRSDIIADTPAEIDVYNLTGHSIPAGEYLRAIQIGGRFCVGDLTNPGGPRIGFRTKSKMGGGIIPVNGEFDASVDWIQGQPLHPLSGVPIVIDDTVQIADPKNKWPEIEPGSTGMAFLRTGLATTPDSRWEVEDASLPVNEVRAFLDDCLHVNDNSGTATLDVTWKLSQYPYVDDPAEIDDLERKITFSNYHRLDGVTNGLVRLKRYTGSEVSQPENADIPTTQGQVTPEWVVEETEQIARKFTGTVSTTGSVVNVTSPAFFDGADPSACGVLDFRLSCTAPCDLSNECCSGSYDPEADQYVVESTASALMGTPTDYDVHVNSLTPSADCGIDYSKLNMKVFPCDNLPASASMTMTTVSVPVSRWHGPRDTTDGGKELWWTDYSVQVCSVSIGIDRTLCLKTECPEQVYTVAQYAEMQNVASEIVSLDQTWTPIVGYEAETYPARGIDVHLPGGTMSWRNEGVYSVQIYLNMEHDESNQSRQTQLRLWSITDGAQVGAAVRVGLARNQSATVISVPFTVEIDASTVGDVVVLEIGAGDNITVTYFDISFGSFSVGEYRS